MVLYHDTKRTLQENYQKKIGLIHQILFFPVVICLFSLNQWKILSLQFSFAFMLRILGYIGCMILLNRALQNGASKKRYFLIGCYTGMLILLISQLYWPALVIMLLIVWGIHLFRCKEKNKQYFVAYVSGFRLYYPFWDIYFIWIWEIQGVLLGAF